MSEIRGQATTQTQTTRPATAGLARSIHLILALLLALGATLAGAGPAGAQEAASLRLTPTRAQVDVNRAIRITAYALDAGNQPIDDANQKTRLSFEPDGTCLQDGGATAIVVVCQKPGIYTVVGVIGGPQVQSEPVTLEVVAEPVPPRISSVRPRSTPPNRKVVVTGTTGSCSQSGTLTLEGLTVAPQPVTGVFNVSFTVLPGVFPGSYPLELSVDCDRQSQLAKGRLRVRNRPPTAADDLGTLSGPEVRIDVTANDTDPDGDDGYQTVVESGLPLHGTAEVQDQMIVYRPGLGFVDRDQFSYRHCDVVDASGKTQCGTGTVAVTTPDPVAKPDTAVTKREQQIAILVTGNDTSPNPAKLRVRTDPKHGVAVVRERPRDGHILYTPEKDFTGTDDFEYDYCEGQGTGPNVAAPDTCPPATVTVTVEPVPVAVDDPDETTLQEQEVSILVTGNDIDPDPEKVHLRTQPKNGMAVVRDQPRDGHILYTPGKGFTGEDSFEYDYCPPPPNNLTAKASCDPATVTVDVITQVPPAIETVTRDPTPPNRDVAVTGSTGSCNRKGTLILHIPDRTDVETPVTGAPDGAFKASLEVPGGTFPRPYQLELAVDCRGKRQKAERTIRVENKAPDAVDDPARATEGTAVAIDVTANDTDPDGDDGYRTVLEADRPTLGTAVVKDQTIEYTPGPGFVDHDQFTYRNCDVVDAAGRRRDCGGATVTVTREQPEPEAVDDPNERTERDRQVDIDVMKNDGHPDAARLQVLPDPAPKGEAVVQPDGAIRYTPEPGATGKDSFGYDYCRPVVNLAARAACDPATVTVDVRPPPQIKTVAADPTPPNKEVVVTGTTGSCQEGTLTLRIPPPGKDIPVAVTAAQDGTFTARLKVPKGTSVGTYALVLGVDCDGRPRGTRRPLRVDNQPPDAVDDPASTPQDTPVVIEVTANDTDPDGDDGYTTSLEAAKPANGTTEVLSGDRIRYTPDRGFAGVDPFTYRLCEVVNAKGKRDCGTATVTVTVVGRLRPVPVDDPDETTLRDRPVVIEVMKNDRNPDAALLEVGRPTRSRASAEEQPDGTVRYTPEPGFTGTDTFPYDYCGGAVDVTAACPSATVTVTVTAEPVISSVEPGSTAPGRPVTVRGSTGSCNRTGTLALQGTGAAVTVTGDQDGGFTASLPVPAGTFPGSYTLELRVDCKGRLQRVERPLVVTNQAPVAADDPASTVRDRPVTIRVAGNDRDPDDPDGYRTLVVVTSPPVRGSAEPQPDLTVVYTPQPGFVGVDRFRYGLCDDVVNRAGQADCGIATVTVTVTDTPAISSVTPGSTSPGRPVQVVGNTGSCSRTGTLTFSGAADLRMRVTGDQSGSFTTTFTVPAGTFPGVYELELGVDCRGQVQRAEAQLTVANQAPDPADDEATTPSGTATTIEVTGNDRDPDDPDTYRTLVVVVERPGHGTAEARPDLSVVYTPDEGFAGMDRFRYGLCDDVVNAAGQADCGTATVTVRVDPVACAPSERDNPSLRVEPARGSGGTRLHITAAVARRLATCQFRLLLGGTPLPPDVSVGGDGSISVDRGVPPNVKPGPSPMRLTTLTAETLAQTPFEVVGAPSPPPPPPNWPVRLLLSAGALAAGFLGRAAFRKWGKGEEGRSRDRPVDLPDDLRAEPHTRPVEATVEPVPDNSRTLAVRLEPHPDSGIQTLEEVTR